MRLIIAAGILIALCILGSGQADKESSDQNNHEENIAANEFDSRPNHNYELIDYHVLKKKPPASYKKSVEKLTPFLVAPAKNDMEKARAIYRWITENIDYDTAGFFSPNYVNTSPDNVLKEHKSICAGYANLFEMMGKEANLIVMTIDGYSKGYGYTLGDKFEGNPNHAWNAVKINGSWYLIDSTWGAGEMDENGQYNRHFEEHYFLTPPSQFVYDHFPVDPRWQLLNDPISQDEFEQLAFLKPKFFEYGLRLGNQQNSTIYIDGESNITIFVPMDVVLTGILSKGNNEDESYSFSQRVGDRYDILVRVPNPDNYTLEIFAKRIGEEGLLKKVAQYNVKALSGDKSGKTFPIAYRVFGESNCYLYYPFERNLTTWGKIQNFKIKVPGATRVSIANEGVWTELTKKGDIFEGEAIPVKGELDIVASFGTASYDSLLGYNVV